MTTIDDIPTDAQTSVGLDRFERNWLVFAAVMLTTFFAVVMISGLAMGIGLNGDDGEVDPRTVTEMAPWNEPGLRQIADGEYEAYILAQAWTFVPREIEVPVGSTVTIYVTSPDVTHGFKITDTNVNTMVVPGQIAKMTYTFDRVGEFPYICHEYCGRGHAQMAGVVNVVAATTDQGSS